MTMFSAHPAGASPPGYEAWDDPAPKPARTSVLAIAALVFALLCVTAPIGLVLGIAALVRVATSNGRRTGTGLAVAAVIISIILSAIWAFMGMGAAQAAKFMVGTPGKAMTALAAADLTAAKPYFRPEDADRLDSAAVARFKGAYEAELGAFKGPPASLWELVASYGGVGPSMQNFGRGQNSRNMMPVPMNFEKGTAVVGIGFVPGTESPNGPGLFDQIMIVLPSGATVELFPRPAPGAAPPPPAPSAPAAPTQPPGG